MKHLKLHNQHFKNLYEEFDKNVLAKGYARGKAVYFQSCVREFLYRMEQKGLTHIKEIKALDIIEHYEHLQERPNVRRNGGLSETTINAHLFSLRLFFDFLLDIGEIESSPARIPKFQIGRSADRNICTLEEIKQLYEVCITKKEKALLSVAYGLGLRRNEIHLLDTNDVLFHKGVLVVRSGKFNKSRTVPMSDFVSANLKEYIVYERRNYFSNQNMEGTPAFFVSETGKRMDGNQLNKMLKGIIQRTQNFQLISKEISLHCLRHSISTHLLENGADIEFVKRILGHSTLDSTSVYIRRRKQQIKYRALKAA